MASSSGTEQARENGGIGFVKTNAQRLYTLPPMQSLTVHTERERQTMVSAAIHWGMKVKTRKQADGTISVFVLKRGRSPMNVGNTSAKAKEEFYRGFEDA